MSAVPGSTNVVPHTTSFSLDLRAHAESEIEAAVDAVREAFARIAGEEGVEVEVEETWRLDATTFDAALRAQLMKTAAESGIEAMELVGVIGHDSLQLSKVTRAAMLFTPTVDGLSHCEEEDSPWEATRQAVAVLTGVLREVADEA